VLPLLDLSLRPLDLVAEPGQELDAVVVDVGPVTVDLVEPAL
jgi:hypothetical protein